MRAWIGLALLSASWLWGLGYYQPGNWLIWTAMVVLGTLLWAEKPAAIPENRQGRVVMAMLLPAIWFMPWPYRMAPLLIFSGLAIQLVPIPRRWPASLGFGALKAGVVLLVQSMGLLAYASFTARSHDLPQPLVWLMGAIAQLIGMESAVDGQYIVMYSFRENYRLAATWDMLLDPASLSYLLGGLALLGLTAWDRMPAGRRWTAWIRAIRSLTVTLLAWLPVRTGLLMALYLHRAMREDLTEPLTTMAQFLNSWGHLAALFVPALLAWRFVPMPWGAPPEDLRQPTGYPQTDSSSRSERLAWALVLAGVAILTFLVEWDPIGAPKAGRVMIVERHSTWEPTTRPYDTKSYGESASYTYAAIYDYCTRFFEMSRLMPTDAINDSTLSNCDVLVVKTPTEAYSSEELEAIERFVAQGGGLFLVGDHTNFERSSTYLNDIARPFGFKFAHDLLFQVGSPYEEWHEWSVLRHPVLQNVPPMYFAGTCTIDPGTSWGRAVVLDVCKWSLPPDYHADNFFPQAEYRPYMRAGAFVQTWATRYGRGRVLAFTDSTQFSNFCTFEPGKAELLLGMLRWLNYSSWLDPLETRLPLVILGMLLGLSSLIVGLRNVRGLDRNWLSLVAMGLLGWTLASLVVVVAQNAALSAPKPVRPLVQVAIDRTVSEVILCRGGFTDEGGGRGYGLLEQWIPRLGYFTVRRNAPEAFTADALVIICPTRSVSDQYRQQLRDYVKAGGKVLVIDSPDSKGTTSNGLLWPFGISVRGTEAKGKLRMKEAWPDIPVESVFEISGGKPLMWVDRTPVAAQVKYGKGTVTVIGFGALLNDSGMGDHWMNEPDAKQLTRFDLLYALVRSVITDRPIVAAPKRTEPST
jgi:hypothetical protein